MWTTIKSGKVWIGDVENRKKNGEPFHTQLLISPILDSEQNVTGYFGVHRDLSEKKTLEKQLIHTQKMESIGTLAAGIAHEVGNPLASISALVQVAQRFTTDDLVKEKLELVKNQVNRISKIIRDQNILSDEIFIINGPFSLRKKSSIKLIREFLINRNHFPFHFHYNLTEINLNFIQLNSNWIFIIRLPINFLYLYY